MCVPRTQLIFISYSCFPGNSSVITLIANLDTMSESYEDKFKEEIYKKYEVIKKIFIPKEQYFLENNTSKITPRNILGVIIDVDENDIYKISVKSGILKTRFSRNQFDLCPQKLLKESDVNCTEEVSLRQAVTEESKSGGQGFVRCNCSGNRRCESNRSKCYKSKIKCSSRCHSCLVCKNK